MQTSCLLSKISKRRLFFVCRFHRNAYFATTTTPTHIPGGGESGYPLYSDVPKPPRNKSERKPYPTPMKTLIRRAKEEREARMLHPCRMLHHPPDNGLLVPQLVAVAHHVHQARQTLIHGISNLIQVIPVQRCRYCSEVHVGQMGHEIRTCTGPDSGFRSAKHVWRKGRVQDVVFFPKCFHLFDRVGKPRVGHDEMYSVPRIPAILELCIQAGLDFLKFPTKRRTRPVYSIEGRIVDFESVSTTDEMERSLDSISSISDLPPHSDEGIRIKEVVDSNLQNGDNYIDKMMGGIDGDLRKLSIQTLDSWFEMTCGAKKIMEKYSVLTCGYCPEVQVGPKGHKVRMCKASKHQSRNGLHAWQEATLDDLVGPNYVWHVRDTNKPALDNSLKRYYGKAPAVVELCVQAGAPVPDQYRSMMRLDVVPPDRDEVDLVA